MRADAEIKMRPARLEDVDAVLALERATGGAPHWPRASYAAIFADEDATAGPGAPATRRCLVLAECVSSGESSNARRIVGFAVGMVRAGGIDAGELESVAVAEGARRGGIGRALCEAVVEWCRAFQAPEMLLEVRAGNAAAMALYAELGFRESLRRARYYRDPVEDAVLLRLPLDLIPPGEVDSTCQAD